MREMDGSALGPNTLHISVSEHDGHVQKCNTVYIRNIPLEVGEREVVSKFVVCGPIIRCSIKRDNSGNYNTQGKFNLASIEFKEVSAASTAVKLAHGNKVFDSCKIPLLAKYAESVESREARRLKRLQRGPGALALPPPPAYAPLPPVTLQGQLPPLPQQQQQQAQQFSHFQPPPQRTQPMILQQGQRSGQQPAYYTPQQQHFNTPPQFYVQPASNQHPQQNVHYHNVGIQYQQQSHVQHQAQSMPLVYLPSPNQQSIQQQQQYQPPLQQHSVGQMSQPGSGAPSPITQHVILLRQDGSQQPMMAGPGGVLYSSQSTPGSSGATPQGLTPSEAGNSYTLYPGSLRPQS